MRMSGPESSGGVVSMRFVRYFVLLGALLALAATPAIGGITPGGIDTDRPLDPIQPDHLANQCFVLWFGIESPSEIGRLQSLGFNVTQTTNPAAITAANLANYDVLVVAYTGPGVLGSAKPLIESFVNSGKGLLIHQPNTPGTLDYAPTGLGAAILSAAWCNFPGSATSTIVDGSHPITLGLTDADLSGALDQVTSLGAGYHLLAKSLVCGDPSVAVGTLGGGRVVFEDNNASPISIVPGSDRYWGNLFSWVCSGGQTPTRDQTWGTVKVLYR